MRIHGFCTGCRRIKRINVRTWMGHGTPVGTCDGCQAPKNPSPRQAVLPRAANRGEGSQIVSP